MLSRSRYRILQMLLADDSIIHDGMVLMEGTPGDIVNNHEVRRVYLGEKFSL